MTTTQRHAARQQIVADLVDQIARDAATLALPDDLIAPSRTFFQDRMAAYRTTILAIQCTDNSACAAAGCVYCQEHHR